MAQVPYLADATVIGLDPDGYGVYVVLDVWGGQSPAIPIDVLTPGPRDGVRMHAHPLPTPGTRGVVCFTRGDDRTGRWIGASSSAVIDASTLVPGSGYVHYVAEYAGGWSWLGQDGTAAQVWADGSTFLAGAVMPAPTRHVLSSGQARMVAPFTAAQRNPKPPGAFPFRLALANGATLVASVSGSISATAAEGQTISLAVSGGASLTLASGMVMVDGADGQGVTLAANGASVTLNTDGSVTITAAGGKTITTTGGGTVQGVRLADGSVSTVLRAQ